MIEKQSDNLLLTLLVGKLSTVVVDDLLILEEVLTVVEVLLLTDKDELVAHVLTLVEGIKEDVTVNVLDVGLLLKMLEKSMTDDSSSATAGIGGGEGDSLL